MLRKLSGLFGLLLLSAMISLSAQGCSKDKSDDPASPGGTDNPGQSTGTITLNGGPFNNVTYNYNSDTSGTLATVKYDTEENKTIISFYKDTIAVGIEFHGKTEGEYNWTGIDTPSRSIVAVTQYKTGGGIELRASYGPIEGKGRTTVTKYGNTGSTIQGSFSGQLILAFGSGSPAPVTVSGSFSVVRK